MSTRESVMKDANLAVFLKNVAAFKEHRQGIEAELEQCQRQIFALRQESYQLQLAPVSREDFIKAMQAQVTHLAQAGRKRVALALGHKQGAGAGKTNALTADVLIPSHIKEVFGGTADFGQAGLTVMFAADPLAQPRAGMPLMDHVSLCMLFEEHIKAALKTNVEATEWPHQAGMSLEQRGTRMAVIVAEIIKLERRSDELANALADAVGG